MHGRTPIIKDKNFDAIIVPGDVCDDRGIKPYSKNWGAHIKEARKKWEKELKFDDYLISKIGRKKLNYLEQESLKGGRKIMEFLNSFGKPVLFTPGNWDKSYGPSRIKDPDKSVDNYLKMFHDFYLSRKSNPKLIKGLKNVYDCQYHLHKFQEFNVLGYGLSSAPESPFLRVKFKFDSKQKKRLNISYKRLLSPLSKEYNKRNKKIPTIFVSHNIPYNTKLDIILDKKSYAYKKHLGSSVARWFCEKKQPLVCIGGHIHDFHAKDKIGNTIVINAGYGPKVNTYFDIENGKLKNLNFNS